MSVSVCECVLCLLPSLLLLLLSLALRWPTAQLWLWLAARAGAWRLWLAVCWLLELPQLNITAEGAWDEDGPVGTTWDRSGPEQSSTPRQHWPRRGVACQPTALAQHLFQHCGSLALPRLAAWPRGDPHVQTLRGLLWGSCCDSEQSRVQFSREHLLMRDGGTVALDWAVEAAGRESRAEAKREREHQPAGTKALGCFTSTPPVLILVPQFWGGLTPHLKELCHLALCQGFYAVVFHPRGTAGCPLTTPQLTEFGDPADLEQAVAYVRNCHPSSVLVAVSEGSGSGVLLSYLGECGSASHLTAAATISPVLRGQLWFQTPMPPVYRWGALIHRKLQFSRYATSFSAAVDVDRILRSSSLRDYEEALFCSSTSTQPRQTTPRPPTPGPPTGSPGPPTSSPGPPTGRRSGVTSPPRGVTMEPSEVWALGERAYPAKDWDGYWERNEPLRDADEVAVPVLCVRSRDDPLLPPASTTPLPLFHSNPYFLLVTTDTGGHCGFARHEWGGTQGGPEKATTRNWSHAAILEYFRLVADFLKEERRGGARGHGAMVGREGHGGQGRSRPGAVLPPRRRRGNVVRRTRTQTQQIFEGEESGEFTWRRSYTR